MYDAAITDEQSAHSLVELLPYSKDIQLSSLVGRIRVLHVLIFICQSAQAAIRCFLAKEYNNFDAQVSENLCQIRAYQLIQLIQNEDNNNELLVLSKHLDEILKKQIALLDEYKSYQNKRPSCYIKNIDQSLSLLDWMIINEFNLLLTDRDYFLIQTFILSKYKTLGLYETSYIMDYDRLCLDLKIPSKTYIEKVIHCFQRNISKQSCKFIFQLLTYVNINKYHMYLLNALYFNDEVGRHVIACYEVTKIILQHLFVSKNDIKIKVFRLSETEKDSFEFILKPNIVKNTYVYNPNETNVDGGGLMIFTGIVNYKNKINESKISYIKRFLEEGFENIILANMAQHPQYSGRQLSDKKENPYHGLILDEYQENSSDFLHESQEKFCSHKETSKKIGCCSENSSLFLLTHVRCEPSKNNLDS